MNNMLEMELYYQKVLGDIDSELKVRTTQKEYPSNWLEPIKISSNKDNILSEHGIIENHLIINAIKDCYKYSKNSVEYENAKKIVNSVNVFVVDILDEESTKSAKYLASTSFDKSYIIYTKGDYIPCFGSEFIYLKDGERLDVMDIENEVSFIKKY